MTEIENSELMCDVYRQSEQRLRELLKKEHEEKMVVVSLLLKHKPELKSWVESNINE